MIRHKVTGEKSQICKRILVLVKSGWTGTKLDMAERVFTTARGIDSFLSLMKACGLVRIVDWRIRQGRGAQRYAIYGWGGGEPDAPKPVKTTPLKFSTADSLLVQQILEVLADATLNIDEVAAACAIHYEVARSYLRIMRLDGLVHIARWDRVGAHPPKVVYAAGKGNDAKLPKKRTKLEASRHRRRMLTEKFGAERAKSIMTSRRDGGVDRIVVDGRVAWERGPAKGGLAHHDAI